MPGPIFAISMMESHKRSELIRRFSPGAAIQSPLISFLRSGGGSRRRPTGRSSLVYRAQNVPDMIDQFVDLALGDDQRRRQRDDVARGADKRPALECLYERREGPLGRASGDRRQLDRADQADIANVDDMRLALQRMQRVFPIRRQLLAAGEQAFFLVGVERAEGRGAGDRVTRISVAVE